MILCHKILQYCYKSHELYPLKENTAMLEEFSYSFYDNINEYSYGLGLRSTTNLMDAKKRY